MPPRLPDLSLLVADESRHVRQMVREMVQRVGIRRVLEVQDGAEAMDVLAEARPDLAVVDWDLPGVSGEDLIKAARTISTSPAPRIPIVLMLARPRRSIVAKAADLGVNEVITKPFSPAMLWSRLDDVVRRPRPFIAQGDFVRPQPRGAALTEL